MTRAKPTAAAGTASEAIRSAEAAYRTLDGYLRLARIAEAYDLTDEIGRIAAGVAAAEAEVDAAVAAALLLGARLGTIASLAPDAMERAGRVFPPKAALVHRHSAAQRENDSSYDAATDTCEACR